MSQGKKCIATKHIGKMVMIRTYSAGVHYGRLVDVESAANGYDVELEDTRRIYEWSGAFTLSALATKGTSKKEKCKFSITIPNILLLAIEIIIMTDGAVANLNSVATHLPA